MGIMPLFVNRSVNPGSGGKDSTSSAVVEQDFSGLPEGPRWFSAFSPDAPTALNVSSTSASSSDGSGVPQTIVVGASGGINFNLTFDSFAPSSFRTSIQQAASMLTSVLSDQITVNLTIHNTGTGGGAFARPSVGLF